MKRRYMNTEAVRQLLRQTFGGGTFLTRDAASEKYSVTLRTIDRWIHRGWARRYFTVNRVWIRAEDLEPHLAPGRRTCTNSLPDESAN